VGNQNASNFAYGSAMKAVPTAWGTGYFPENYANDKLTWERTKAWNVGLDLSFLDNRIEFIVDAYFKKTDDLLMVASLPAYLIPTESYYGIRAPWVNAGSIQNKGIEFTLNTVNVATADWQWRTNATISFNRNKLT
jgi:outer membrane cobalamin receptor